jgi:hypothetical protein
MTKRIRVDRILLPEPVSAGMNFVVLGSMAHHYRSTTDDLDPIMVTREGKHYRITDGRHRWLASVIAGRRRVLTTVEKKPWRGTAAKA